MKAASLVIALILSFPSSLALAQADADAIRDKIYQTGKAALVRLSVTGHQRNGEPFNQTGTGFYYQSNTSLARIMTARHVVGANSEIDDLPGGKFDRRITVTISSETTGKSDLPQDLQEISEPPSDDRDVAFIFTNWKSEKQFRLSKRRPKEGDRVWVLSWPTTEDVIQRPTPAIVRASSASDRTLLSLNRESGQFVSSESGSPVLDETGAVVAVLILRRTGPTPQPIGLAIPVAEFASGWLPDDAVDPIASEVADYKAWSPIAYDDTFANWKTGDMSLVSPKLNMKLDVRATDGSYRWDADFQQPSIRWV